MDILVGVWVLELVARFIVCLMFYMLCLLLLLLGLWCVTIVYCWCFVIRVQVVNVFCYVAVIVEGLLAVFCVWCLMYRLLYY